MFVGDELLVERVRELFVRAVSPAVAGGQEQRLIEHANKVWQQLR